MSTHGLASLDEAFLLKRPRRIVEQLEVHYATRNGARLNLSEIEPAVLAQRHLGR